MKIKALLVDRSSLRKQTDIRLLNFLIVQHNTGPPAKVIHYHTDSLYLGDLKEAASRLNGLKTLA